MALHYFEENFKKPRLKYRQISSWIKQIVISNNKKVGDICFVFCDNAYLLNINKQYLEHDYYTDIITFDYVKGDLLSGDIFISCEMVAENAEKFGVLLEEEFLRVIVHGVLHLMGYRDQTENEKKLMREKETECILEYKN